MSTRQSDMRRERICAQWMDQNFWKPGSGHYERLDDLDHQLHGIDCRLYSDKGSVYFDEKFKLSNCLNKKLNAIGFEMSLLLKGEVRDGWFAGDWAQADMIATVQLSANVDNYTYLSNLQQITAADILWTNKMQLKRYVESFGTSVKELLNMSNKLREEYDKGFMETRIKFPHGAFWLTLSPTIDEMPVNLVVPFDTLLKLPGTHRFVVQNHKIERII